MVLAWSLVKFTVVSMVVAAGDVEMGVCTSHDTIDCAVRGNSMLQRTATRVVSSDDPNMDSCTSGDPSVCAARGNSMLQRTAAFTLSNSDKSETWELFAGPYKACSTIFTVKHALKYVWKSVESEQKCQAEATNKGHDYYQFQADNLLCATAAYCYDQETTINPWKIYKKKNPDKVCKCGNGQKAESGDCTVDGEPKCVWCKDGFSLVKHRCKPTVVGGGAWVAEAGGGDQTCAGTRKIDVAEQHLCQERADRKRHRYYIYNEKKKKCWTGHYCHTPFVKNGWKLYKNSSFETPVLKSSTVVNIDRNFKNVCSQYDDSVSPKEKFLATHNYLRCLHSYDPLLWDKGLETNSEAAAKHSADLGTLEHTNYTSENLGIGTNPLNVNFAWYEEILLPTYVWPGDTSWQTTGHFTAMIWKYTPKFGCANSENGHVQACQYAPSEYGWPNMQGQWEDNVPGPEIEWVNDPAFCCREAFKVTPCDDYCSYQAAKS